MKVCCPVCRSSNNEHIYLKHKGTCVTSDHKIAENVEIDNCICKECGLIFNAYGTRLDPDNFYKKLYNLMVQNEDSKVQSFIGGIGQSQALITYEIFKEMVPLGKVGSILEAGAGKGEFLSYFSEEHTEWDINAFEPSQSFKYLKDTIKGANVVNCGYEKYTKDTDALYDVIVSLGVLEHVNNPLDMIRWFNANLSVGGYCFIRVPNFKNNPNDLFCADHLSKLTIETVISYANASGFKVVAVEEKGVPLYMCIKKISNEYGEVKSVYSTNHQLAITNGKLAKKSIDLVIKAREESLKASGKFAIFGLGSAGIFAPFYGGFQPSDIAVFIDENKTLWGNTVLERPVLGLEAIVDYSITHIALSVSPSYREQIIAKLCSYNLTIY